MKHFVLLKFEPSYLTEEIYLEIETAFAAGPGIKKNFVTDRYVHHIDVAPTAALLMGLEMPAQCEGAPVYQILENKLFD